MKKRILVILLLFSALAASACTSIIISGKRTASGKPIIFKNRDTDCLDNRLQWFQVGDMRFVGIVNAPVEDGEVWSGTNEKGFSIINTAVYNFNEDSLHPECPEHVRMDREGEVMYRALCVCTTVEDFLRMLDTLPKPLGVEANFGVVDAKGGAMYVECNNWRYVTYDVNAIPEGYRIQTNFAFAGNPAERMGVERYRTASAIMAEQQKRHSQGNLHVDTEWLLTHFSRSFRHETIGTKENNCPKSGVCIDQDFIPRRITSCVFCAEGANAWVELGYPCCGVAFPIVVADRDILPTASKRTADSRTCAFSDTNMRIKMQWLFPDRVSNGKHYLHIGFIRKGDKQHPSMIKCAAAAEKEIHSLWQPLYSDWQEGRLSDQAFYERYVQIADRFYPIYLKHFSSYIDE